MATELERLMVRIDATTEQLRREIDKADKRITDSSRHMERQQKKIEKSFNNMGVAAKRFAAAAASAFVTRQVVQYADAYKTLENRIKVANDGIGDVTQTLNKLYDIAQKTRVPLEGTVTLFQRASMAANELGASQEQLYQFTENVSKALAIQGGSAATASGALLQLSQALGADIVRAEEFNSILEGAYPIAQAAAKGIERTGGSVAKLRQEIIAGNVTSKEFFDAILSQTEELEKTFGQTTATIGQSFQRLNDSFVKYIGSSEAATGLSQLLAEAINYLADNIDDIIGPVDDLARGIRQLNNDLPNTSALFNTIAGSGIALGSAFGLIDKEIANMAIAESLQRSNKELGQFAAYADHAAIKAERFKDSITFLSDDEGSAVAINARIASLKEMASSAEMSAETEAALNAEMARLNKELEKHNRISAAIPKGNKKIKDSTKESTKAAKEATKAIEEQNKALEEQQKQLAEDFSRPFENAMDNIQDAMTNTFEDVFDSSIDSAADAADAIKRIFIRMAAEMATLAIFRPQVFSAGMGGGISGGIGSMINGATTQSGGFGGLGDLASLGNVFSGGSLGSPIFGAGSFIGSNIDAIGGALGLGNAGFIGPMQPGQLAPLSGAFTGGAALAGLGGTLAADLLGLSNGIGSTIGGTAGGLIGTAFGGPIGAALGSFLGSSLGGLFGGSKPHPAATVGLSGFSSSGSLQGVELQAKHLSTEDAKRFADALGTVTGAVAAATGVDFSQFTAPEGGTAFQAGVNDGQGFFTFGSHKSDLGNERVSVTFNPEDEADLNRALGDLAKLFVIRADDIGQEVNETLLGALDNIETEGRSVDEVMADIAFAAGFDKLGEVPQDVSEMKQAFDALKQVFSDAAETAERLGLEVEKVREFEESRIEMFRRSVAQGTALELLNMIDPARANQLVEDERFRKQMQDLEAIGASQEMINQATLLHQLRMEEITKQQSTSLDIERERLSVATDLQRRYSRVESSFTDLLQELEFGRFTANTPTANLDAMRARINELSGPAGLGDIAAQEELAELLPAFLELSGEVNGYNMDFARDRELAQRVAENTLSVAERQIKLQQVEIEKAQELINATNEGFANLDQTMASLGVTIESLVRTAQGGAPITGAQNAAGRSLDEAVEIKGTGKRLTVGQIEALGASLLGGYSGPTGSGQIAKELEARGLSDTFNKELENMARAQGFSTGGLVLGAAGNDNIPARLSNREFVMRADAVRSVGVAAMQEINATGRLPQSGGMDQKMDQLINATIAVGRAVADSGNLQADKQQAVVDALDGIRRTQRVAALS